MLTTQPAWCGVLAAGWDSWGASVKPVPAGGAGGSKVAGAGSRPATAPTAAGGLNKQHSLSSPALHNKDDDDWGKW